MSAALIISLITFLAILYSGYRNGLFSSAATLFMVTVSIALAVAFYGPVAATTLVQNLGDYAEPLCLFVFFVVVYFVLQMIVNMLAPPALHMRRSISKVGGVALSVANATLLSGFMGLVFCMMPWMGIQEGELAGKSFIGTSEVTEVITKLVRETGGNAADPDALFARLKIKEEDSICHSNLNDIKDRVSDLYRGLSDSGETITEAMLRDAVQNGTRLPVDGAAGGKGVGVSEMFCPGNGKPYVFVAIPIGALGTSPEKKKIQVYDVEASHKPKGQPARMVLWTWRGRDPVTTRVGVQGVIELMTEEQFNAAMEAQDAK